jgi:pimeloyl-ACP methyl ester carboxylesterase
LPFAENGSVRLWYETIGAENLPTVLLLGGAGKQSIDASDGFCTLLVAGGFRVIRYDQRDTGKSTNFACVGSNAAEVGAAIAAGRTPKLIYNAHDMAADAIAVLDAAGTHETHLFGRSLGAYVAQLVALDRPARIKSMTLAMAFSRGIGGSVTPERLAHLDAEIFETVDDLVKRTLATARAVGNPDYFDAARLTVDAERAWTRGMHRGASARHFAVGLAADDIRPQLAAVNMPVQFIVGALDRVIAPALAGESAAAMPGASLAILDDMAHEGPPQLWQRWADLFLANAARAI